MELFFCCGSVGSSSMASSTLDSYNARSIKRTQELFGDVGTELFLEATMPSAKRAKLATDSMTNSELDASEIKMACRIMSSYNHVKDIPTPGTGKKAESAVAYLSRTSSKSSADGMLFFSLHPILIEV
jgi:hypothetical protein